MYRGFHPRIDPPTDDPERAVLVLVLMATLTVVPAMMGKLFLTKNLGWPQPRARVLAFGAWAAVNAAATWQLLH